MQFAYQTRGVCSQKMYFTIENDVLTDLTVTGGCSGNLEGITRLVRGMPVGEVIDHLSGVRCGEKPSSCPDQLAQALKAAVEK